MVVAGDGDPPFERLQFFAQRHRPRRMPIAHWHSQIELNYLLNGQMTYLINGRLVPLSSRRLGVFWGATPHQVVDQERESDLVVIYLPLGEFLRLSLPHDLRKRLMGGGFVVGREADPVDGLVFPRWYEDLQTGKPNLKDLVRREIGCRLRRLAVCGYENVRAIDVATNPGRSASDASIQRVRAMAVYMAEHFARPLTVGEIAGAAAVHPNYAMTLFRRVVGMTISEYLVRQRLSRVQSMLVDTDLPVPAVARASGFGSQSRFYEAFRQWVGMSPTHYRSELTAAAAGLSARGGYGEAHAAP